MKKAWAWIAALVVAFCTLPATTVGGKAAEEKSILSEQASSGSYVYSDGGFSISAATSEECELNTLIKGASGYIDSAGVDHSLSDIELHIGMKIRIVDRSEAHTVPSLIIAEDDVSKTYIQQRMNGALYLLQDYTDGRAQSVREFVGITLSVGTVYTLEVDYAYGNVDVKIDGTLRIESQKVDGIPVIKFCTFGARGDYFDFTVTTTSDAQSFIKTFPDPAEGNENLLDLPGFVNRVSSEKVSVEGNDFLLTELCNENMILTNDYLSSLRYYRPDVKEYSDGTDLDYLIETTLEFGDYPSSVQPWYGFGLIIGEIDKAYVALRAMNTGNLFLHGVNKTSGDTVYDVNSQFGAFRAAKGSRIALRIYYVGEKLSVFVNDSLVLKNYGIDMSMKLGIHSLLNKGKIENLSFRFIQPVVPSEIEPKSEETARFAFSRGKKTSEKAEKHLTGDVGSFSVGLSGGDDYFVMQSLGADAEELYRMTGLESYVVAEQSSLATVVRCTVGKAVFGTDGYAEIVFRHNAQGYKHLSLKLYADGRAAIEQGSLETQIVAEASYDPTETLAITVVSLSGEASVSINGNYVFTHVGLPGTDNAVGFGGKNCSYTVEGLTYRYIEDVRFEKPEKEQFVPVSFEGEANTEYIEPPLPEKEPTSGGKTSGCKSGLGGAAAGVLAFPAFAAVSGKRKKTDRSKSDDRKKY